MQILFLILSLFFIAVVVYMAKPKKNLGYQPDKIQIKNMLQQYVLFYQQLSNIEKSRFEANVQSFLMRVRITGVKTNVEDLDRILLAAAAIIPIFSFTNWEYRNINEVLIYPGSFNENYSQDGQGRNITGMVGNGPMQYVMIISKDDLRNGFLNSSGQSNTAIHEFVHLLDKADGSIDGLPEALLPHQYTLPWLKLIHQEIQQIQDGNSDINPYASLNESEFFAVAAEYFFKQPNLMQLNHPDLFKMLEKIFKPSD